MLRAYKFQLKPDKEEEILLSKHFGCCRFVYNYILGLHNENYKSDKSVKWNRFTYQNIIPELKKDKDHSFLKEVNSQSLQCAVLNLDRAFRNFFEKRGKYPAFKSKHNKQSFHVPQNVKIKEGKLIIPKFLKGIKINLHRDITGEIRNATISKSNDRYFVSIVAEDGISPVSRIPDIEKAIGIDLGIKEFAILSTGEKIENPKHYIKSQKRLKRLSRKHSRKIKGSNNRNKSCKKLSKFHNHVSNQRKDFHHKLSHKIVNDNQIDIICLENLNVKGMVRNHKLSRSISDAGWSQFKIFLKYKAERIGKIVIEIGRFEASSQLCNVCGYKNKELTLSAREWICPICGTIHDRDINAAINVRNIGIRTLGTNGSYACGDSVRHLVGMQLSSRQEALCFC
jgi:putative transposase